MKLRQEEQDKYHLISLTQSKISHKQIYLQNKKTHKENRLVVANWERRREGGLNWELWMSGCHPSLIYTGRKQGPTV